MQIIVPVIPTEPTPPGAVPVIMPPNNYDPATATTPPDYGGDYAPSAFRTPDGGVYMVMPTQIHYIVRPLGLTTYWSSEAGDYVLPAPPNWNCWSWGTKYADGHLSWGMSPVLQFGTGIDAPTGWAMCSTPPDGYSWPSDMPDGVRGDHSWELFAEGITTVDWPLLQAMSTEPILESWVRKFAVWHGERRNRHEYKWQTLATACAIMGIDRAEQHRAHADASDTLKVLHAIAQRSEL